MSEQGTHDQDAPALHCLRCGYDLTGLPQDHRCPECGFGFQHEAIHRLALGYADFKLAAYIRVARLSIVAAVLALISTSPRTLAIAPSVLHVLLLGPLAALGVAIYCVREVRNTFWSFPRLTVVVLMLAASGLVPNVVPAILLVLSILVAFAAAFEFTSQARRFPYARLSLDERWTQELRRYRRGAWAAILAAAGALALAWR
jgi:hypothetical protein